MIVTTFEKSKHLLELGQDPDSADMYYTGHRSIHNPKEIEYTQEPRVRTKFVSFDRLEVFFPAWSLTALLEVMPKEMLPALEWREGNEEWEANVWINHNIHCISHYDKLCAVYSMVCWLLEQGLIKKGGQDD